MSCAVTGDNGGRDGTEITILFEDDFEDGDISDWTVDGIHLIEVSLVTGANGTTSSLSISGSGGFGAYIDLEDIKPTYVSFYAKASETDKDAGYLYLNSGGIERISFRFAAAGYVTINSGVTNYFYAADEWCFVEIKNINWSVSPPTFDFYVDESPVETGEEFMNWDTNPVLYFDRIQTRNFDSTFVWFDEIMMH